MSFIDSATGRSGGGMTLEHLLEILIDHGLLSEEQAQHIEVKEGALRARILRGKEKSWSAIGRGVPYEVSPAEVVAAYRAPSEDGHLTEDVIMEAVAMSAGFPYVKIDPLKLDTRLIASTLSRPYAQKHIVMPLERSGGRMTVAVDNPFDIELIDGLRRLVSSEVDVVVSSKSDILKCIREIYGFKSSVAQAAEDMGFSIDLGNLEQYMKLRGTDEIDDNDAHVVKAVEYLLRYAFEQRASDIHIEPKREVSTVRLRIDGALHTVYQVPRVVHPAMVSRIKTLARMDIAEKRRPQDGRIETTHAEREVELRISSMPVAFGEKVVIRIFDPQILLQTLDGLGFFKKELAQFQSFIRRPHGIILVTGPTGSGKTTTLYSALRELASPEINIVTIEDPIEMVVEDFNQVSVQSKVGITFSSALRTILRQDPDIIMVGEIRDEETADNAVQAALTGHLVLSTLHTNDAAGAVTRMQDLGIPPFLIASTVIGVVAQRLVRKVCARCKTATTLTRDQLQALSMNVPEGGGGFELQVFRGAGCVHCRQTGLSGRTGVYEVMPMTERIRTLVNEQKDSAEITRVAQVDGMMTLRECAIKKMAQGVTAFDEVIRATSEQA